MDVEEIETDLLLEGILQKYGHSFHNYARSSLKRRLKQFLKESKVNNISDLIPKILHDESFFNSFMFNMSVTVTEMFRDPHFFLSLRQKIIPVLKTYPFIKIWHAGCATGEEVYSMAIILHEEGLLKRTQIYATDFNSNSLEIAKDGIYPLERIQLFTKNYLRSGGRENFSDYYRAKYNSAKLIDTLKENITFSTHNLATDSSFGEMNLIICRNVMIYFDEELQNKVFSLFKNSLCSKSFLCLGTKESIDYSNVKNEFVTFLEKEKIYRKKSA